MGAFIMPKYDLFKPLDFLAYVKTIHVSYHPGRPRCDPCRQLIQHMRSAKVKKKFPLLQASYELLGYSAPSTVKIELTNGAKYHLSAESLTLKEMHSRFDQDQFRAFLEHMKSHSIEAKPGDEDF